MASCAKKRQQRIAKRQQNRNTKKYFNNPTLEQQDNIDISETYSDENEENNSTEVEAPVEETVVESETENNFHNKKNKKVYDIKRGEIYFFKKIGNTVGVEQEGGRPGIVVSNNLCNKHSEFVEIVYTTCQPKTVLPTHVIINSTKKTCTALCEQVHTVSKGRIECYYGEATPEEMVAINAALKVNLSIEGNNGYNDSQDLTELKNKNNQLLEENEKLKAQVEVLAKVTLENIKAHNDNKVSYKELYDNLIDKMFDKIQGKE